MKVPKVRLGKFYVTRPHKGMKRGDVVSVRTLDPSTPGERVAWRFDGVRLSTRNGVLLEQDDAFTPTFF